MTYASLYAIFLHFSTQPLILSSTNPLSLRAFAAEIEVAAEREGHQEQGEKGIAEGGTMLMGFYSIAATRKSSA